MRTVQVDYNNTIGENRLVASRRRMPELAIKEIVTIADDADDATYLAQVESIEDKQITFLVSWSEQHFPRPQAPAVYKGTSATSRRRVAGNALRPVLETA